ncbi:MAG: hypothetical protein QM503_06590 [Bacteroidota bacterium]
MEPKKKKKTAIEVKMQLLKDGIKSKEEKGENTDFSLHIILEDEPGKKVPVVERDNGYERFDAALERAQDYGPETIIVHTFRNKSDRKGTVWSFNVGSENETNERPLREQITETVKSEIKKISETGNSEGLGAVEKYEHLGEILTLKSERQLTELKHGQQLAELNRQLTEKHEIIGSNEKTIEELEKENKLIIDEFETYKTDRLAGVSKSISQAGMSIVSNLASQYLPQLLGSGITAGMAGVNEGQKTTIVEDDDPRSLLVDQIRLIIADYDQETFIGFYQLMELITSNPSTIGLALKHFEKEVENNEINVKTK